jgi:hypothetical protein
MPQNCGNSLSDHDHPPQSQPFLPARTLRAARDAGFDVARFEVDPISGRIVVMIDKNDAAARADDRNPWDEVA